MREDEAPGRLELHPKLSKGAVEAARLTAEDVARNPRIGERVGILVEKDKIYDFIPGKHGWNRDNSEINRQDVKAEQVLAATLHTHPDPGSPTSHAFSASDFSDFLSNPERLTVMQVGEETLALAKTVESDAKVKGAQRLAADVGQEFVAEQTRASWAVNKAEGRVGVAGLKASPTAYLAGVRAANAEMVKKYHLILYAGRGGVLTRVNRLP